MKVKTKKLKTEALPISSIRQQIVGIDNQVPLLNGSQTRYINFDNAASTPVLAEVLNIINDFMPWYSSIHRGSGYKSLISTKVYEAARETVLEFFGGNHRDHVVIFGKNSTEALNKLSYRIPLKADDVVLVSLMEHHSNDLPWRGKARVVRIGIDSSGRLDEGHFDQLLKKYGKKIKLVTLTGASNVTGEMPNIHGLAAKTHAIGAEILIDAAQLAPHRSINVKPLSDPTHLDYIVVSAHKMYAPFGTGAIIGRRDTFSRGEPEYRGGGTIDLVTTRRVEWTDCPDRDEAGSPNVVGAVAFAAALKLLSKIGMTSVAAHQAELTKYLLSRLNRLDKIQVFGDTNPANAANRLGVIPFNVDGLHHSYTAAILGTEFGIGVRSGCFCAHPYVVKLLNVNAFELKQFGNEVTSGDKRHMPGLVRASFGIYNSQAEIDRFLSAITKISAGQYFGSYRQNKKTGDFTAVGWEPRLKLFE